MPVASAKSSPSLLPDRWQALLPGLALALLVVIVYLPALHGQFIWDDDYHVLKSTALHSLAGLWRIWFHPGATQQFYPLTYSSFWIDYQLWGLNPLPYHAENILLHAINAVLVWQLLWRLNVPGAWLGAALFALHPVCVESVAWISERKNTLSGLCFFLSLWMAIEFWLPQNPVSTQKTEEDPLPPQPVFGPWKFFWLALAFYLGALWSKTVTAGLPGVILLLVWWKRGRLRWKDATLVLPFLALGLAMGLITVSIEHKFVIDAANANEWAISWPAKFIIAGRDLWFYLGKLVWPHPLMFVYPRWIIEPSHLAAYLPLAVAAGVFLALVFMRPTWARSVLVAVIYFVVVLSPALGFVNVFPFRYSFVADHFQYLAAIGPLALLAAGITLLATRFSKIQWLKPALVAGILAAISILTWRQTHIYKNLEVLWTDTLARNPAAWMAEDNLGLYLTGQGRYEEADAHYRKAIEIRANDHIAYYDLGLESAIQGNLDLAAQYFIKTLELNPDFAMANYELGNVRVRQGNFDEAIKEYDIALKALPNLAIGHFNLAMALVKQGKLDEATKEYRRTLEEEPGYVPAHIALGGLLAAKGNSDDAITQYRAALKDDPNSVQAMASLANALVSKGQFDDAITYYHSALQLDPNSPELHFNLSVALTREGNATEAASERAEAQRLNALRAAGH